VHLTLEPVNPHALACITDFERRARRHLDAHDRAAGRAPHCAFAIHALCILTPSTPRPVPHTASVNGSECFSHQVVVSRTLSPLESTGFCSRNVGNSHV
jgi:hypothetical protein